MYYIIQIGNGLYYNQRYKKFTSYKENATWFKSEKDAEKTLERFKEHGIHYKLITYERVNETDESLL